VRTLILKFGYQNRIIQAADGDKIKNANSKSLGIKTEQLTVILNNKIIDEEVTFKKVDDDQIFESFMKVISGSKNKKLKNPKKRKDIRNSDNGPDNLKELLKAYSNPKSLLNGSDAKADGTFERAYLIQRLDLTKNQERDLDPCFMVLNRKLLCSF
jgi:hypothetical protein